MKKTKPSLEDSIEYYHLQFHNFASLVKLGKWVDSEGNREKINRIITDYREKFKKHEDYLETFPSMAEYFLN